VTATVKLERVNNASLTPLESAKGHSVSEREAINMNIYVGNLSPEVTEDELREAFTAFGQVTSVNIIKDRYSGQSRGFAFVEMPKVSEGQAAVAGLKGKTLRDRILNVSEARPRSERRGGGFGGGGRRRY